MENPVKGCKAFFPGWLEGHFSFFFSKIEGVGHPVFSLGSQ